MLLGKPVIAAVEGHAVAGGLELALWCDMRVAAEDAVFGVYCRRWGIPLMDGGTVRLPRLIGHSHALDLILTGRGVSGEERSGWGSRTGSSRRVRRSRRRPRSRTSWPRCRRRHSAAIGSRPTSSGPSPRRGARRRVPPRDGDAGDGRDVRRARRIRVGRVANQRGHLAADRHRATGRSPGAVIPTPQGGSPTRDSGAGRVRPRGPYMAASMAYPTRAHSSQEGNP